MKKDTGTGFQFCMEIWEKKKRIKVKNDKTNSRLLINITDKFHVRVIKPIILKNLIGFSYITERFVLEISCPSRLQTGRNQGRK